MFGACVSFESKNVLRFYRIRCQRPRYNISQRISSAFTHIIERHWFVHEILSDTKCWYRSDIFSHRAQSKLDFFLAHRYARHSRILHAWAEGRSSRRITPLMMICIHAQSILKKYPTVPNGLANFNGKHNLFEWFLCLCMAGTGKNCRCLSHEIGIFCIASDFNYRPFGWSKSINSFFFPNLLSTKILQQQQIKRRNAVHLRKFRVDPLLI